MTKQLLSINEAAALLGVSAKTLRRWEAQGKITPHRTIGNQRRYDSEHLQLLKNKKPKAETPQAPVIAPSVLPSQPVSETAQPAINTNEFSTLEETQPISKEIYTETLQEPHDTPKIFVPFDQIKKASFGKFAFAGAGAFAIVALLGVMLLAPALKSPAQTFGNILSFLGYQDESKYNKVDSDEAVLATDTKFHDFGLKINVPAEFMSTASVAGKLTAPNIVYGLIAGTNVSITGDPQNPIISASSSGVTSINDLSGSLALTAGSGITIDGLTITNTDPGSTQNIFGNITVGSTTITAGSNSDTFSLSAGTGITLSADNGTKTITITGQSPGASGISGIVVEEGNTTISASATNLDFLGGDFDVGESPSGEANIQLASTLTSVTGVSGAFSVGGALTVGGDSILDFTGDGLTLASNTLSINLATSGTAGATSSNSGLEIVSGGLTLLKGCADGQVLKWDDTGTIWQCAADAGAGGSGISTVENNESVIGSGFDTLDFSSLFSVTASPANEANITIAPDALNFTELSDSLTLDAATTITNSLAGDLTIDLTSTGDFVIADTGTPFFTFTDSGALTQAGSGLVTLTGNVDATNGLDVSGTDLTVGGTNATITTAGVITGTQLNIDNLRLDGNTLSSPAAGDLILDAFSGIVRIADLTTDGVVYTSGTNGTLNTESALGLTRGGTGQSITGTSITDGQLLIGNNSTDGFSLATLTAGAGINITNGSGSITISQNGAGASKWSQNDALGILTPNISSLDLLFGGATTQSAKFAFLNNVGNTPTASISAGSGNNATFLTGTGILGTANNQTLTLGGTTTGDVVIDSGTGSTRLADLTTDGVVYTSGSNGKLNTEATLSLSRGGLGQSINGNTITDGQLLIGNDTANGFSLGTLTAGSGISITNGSGSITIAQNGSGASKWNQNDSLGTLTPNISSLDVLFGGTSTSSARFAVLNMAGNTPTATLSAGVSGGMFLSANGSLQTTTRQSLTFGGGDTGNIVLSGFGTGILHSNASGVLSSSAVNLASGDVSGVLSAGNGGTGINGASAGHGQLLIGNGGGYTLATLTAGDGISITNGAGSITISQAGAGASKWTQNDSLGILTPNFSTLDVLLGGISTQSAKFAFLNNAGNTPTASISAGSGNTATFLTGTGNIGTTNGQTFTLGGTTTGNIVLDAGSGLISLSDSTNILGNLDLSGTFASGTSDAFQVDATGNITSTGTTGLTFSGAGAGIAFSGSGTHTISASTGTLQFGAATLTGEITGGSQTISGLGQLTVDNLRLDGNTLDATSGNLILDSAGTTRLADLTTDGVVYTSGGNGTLNTESALGLSRGGTGQSITGTSITDGQLLIGNNTTDGFTLANLTAGSGISITNGSGSITISQAGAGASKWTQNDSIGTLTPNNSTLDVLLGGASTQSAKFAFLNNAGNTPTASISANNGANALSLDGSGNIGTTNEQTLTLGSASTGDINLILGAGNQLRVNGTAGQTIGTASCVTTTNGIVTGTASCPAVSANSIWNTGNGAIFQGNTTQDFLLGGISTASAKFAVLNIAGSNNPVATLSSGLSGGVFLTADGVLGTTTNQTLTLGGSTTGDILLSPKGGTGILGLQVAGLTINGATGATSGGPTCVSVTNGIVTGTGSCGMGSGGSVWTLNTSNGTLYPINSTVDVLFGGTATNGAKFAFMNVAGGTPTASISGLAGALNLDGAGNITTASEQTLTLGNASTGDINLFIGSGNQLRINGIAGQTIGTASCVTTTNGIVTGSATCQPDYEPFQLANGAAYLGNTTLDFFIGGTSTNSAKFALTNVSGGTPTASVSAGIAGGLSLTADGTLSTTTKQTLTLGSASTGDIVLDSGNGNVRIADLTTDGVVYTSGSNGRLNTEATLSLSRGGTGLNINGASIGDGQLLIGNDTANGFSLANLTAGSGISITNGAGSITISQAGAGASKWTENDSIGTLTPNISTLDLLFGGATTASAKFAFLNNAGNTPTASISANNGANALSLDGLGNIGTTNKQTLTLGTAATGDINLLINSGNQLRINGTTGQTVGTASCVITVNGIVTGTDACPAVAANNIWNTGGGAIFEGNTTQDLLIGGVSTAAAKFAITNVSGGTPTASLSAGIAGGLSLTADGTLSTTNRQTLSLGSASTGDIVLDSGNGNVRIADLSTDGVVYTSGGNGRLNTEATLNLSRGGTGLNINSGTIADGQLLIGNDTANGFTLANLSAGSGISITNGSGSITISQTGNGSSKWAQDNSLGTLTPNISTLDVLLGGTSTASARFAILNMAGNTPTATLSAGLTGGAFFSADGGLQTTARQSLTFGGGGTGNIVLSGFGTGIVHSNASGVLSSSAVNLASGDVTGILPLANGGTGLNINGTTLAHGQLLIGNADTDGFSLATLTAGSGITINNTAGGITISQTGSGASKWTENDALGTLTPNISTLDLLFGGATTASAKFAFLNNAGNTPTASISANNGANALSLDGSGNINTTNEQTLTLGSASTGDINFIVGAGNQLRINGTAGQTITTNAQCVLTTNGIVTGTGACPAVAANAIWNTGSGTIFEGNTTQDLLIGGVSTAAAKFAITNVAGGTPTATLSAGTSGGAFFTADGSLQTTTRQSLTFGGGGTGNIVLSGFGTGIIHSNASGVLSSSAVDLASADVTGILPLANGGTGQNINGAAVANGQLLIGNADTDGFSLATLTAGSGITINNTAGGITISQTGSGASKWTQNDLLGILTPNISTLDLLFGGATTQSAKFAFLNNAGSSTTPTASISANSGNNAAFLTGNGTLGTTNRQTLSLGSASTGDLNFIVGAGNQLRVNGTAGVTVSSVAQCVFATNGIVTGTDTCDTSADPFQGPLAGAVYLGNTTLDLLIGGISTTSAKFAVTNVSNGSPTATLSAGVNSGAFLTAAGNLGTAAKQTLTIGGTTTGDIVIDSGNGITRLADLTTDGVVYTTGGNGRLNTEATLDLSRGGTGQNINANAITDGQLLIGSNTGNGFVLGNLTAGSGITITNGAGTISISQTGSGASKWTQTDNLGILSPNLSTLDLLFGGATTQSAKFAFLNNAGSLTPTASISANSGNNATFLTGAGTLGTTNKQTLNLGGTSTGDIIIDSGNGNIRLADLSTDGVVYTSGSNGRLNTEASLSLSRGGTGQSINGTTIANGQLLIGNTDTDSFSLATLTAGSGITINNTAGGITIAQTGSGASKWTQSDNLGILTPNISTLDLLFGGATTQSARFAFLNNAGSSTTPTASISANSGNNALSMTGTGTIGTTNKQTLTLGTTSTGDINLVVNTGNQLRISGTAGQTISGTAQCVTTTNGIVTGTGTCDTSSDPWQGPTAGSVYLGNTTLDLLVGGITTASAKFAVLNMAGNTPTASLSAGTTGGAFLTAAGNLATTARQTLTLGGATTGNIVFNPQNGTGFSLFNGRMGINAANPLATLDLRASSGTLPIASFSGQTSHAGLIVDNRGAGDLFTASKSGATRFAIGNDGTMDLISEVMNANDADASSIDINGPYIRIGDILKNEVFPNGMGIKFNDNGISHASIKYTSNASAARLDFCDSSDDSILACNTGAETLSIGLNDTTGRVGIGTTSPAGKLDVRNNIGTIPSATVSGNTAFAGLVVDNRGSGDLFTASSSGLNRFVIKQDGKIGVGTTMPNKTMEIAGVGEQLLRLNSTNTADAGIDLFREGAAGGNGDYRLVNSLGYFMLRGSTDDFAGFTTHLMMNNQGLTGLGRGQAEPLATLDVGGILNTYPSASVSANSTFAAMIVDNRGPGDIFTASASGVRRFTITQNGSIITNGVTGQTVTSAQCVTTTNGIVTGTGTCDTSSDPWQGPTLGAVYLGNTTLDLLVGGTATNSSATNYARAGFLNIAGSLTPVATLSAGTSGGAFLTAAGNLATTANQTLTLGGSTTGNILINPRNSAAGGYLGPVTNNVTDLGTATVAFRNIFAATDIVVGGSSVCLENGTNCPAGVTNYWDQANGALSPKIITNDLLIGGISSTSARFHAYGSVHAGTTPAASISANSTFAGLIANNRGSGDIFAASSGGLTRFVVRQDGKVGIGTTIPTATLDVRTLGGGTSPASGAFRSTPGATGANQLILDNLTGAGNAKNQLAFYANGTERWSIGNDAGGVGGQNFFFYNATANTTPLYIDGQGKFALNNGSNAPLPIASFDLRSAVATAPIASISGSTNAGFAALVVNNSGTGDLFTASSSGDTRFVIKQSGKVGIGTALPSADLHLVQTEGTTPGFTLTSATQSNLNDPGNFRILSSTGTTMFDYKDLFSRTFVAGGSSFWGTAALEVAASAGDALSFKASTTFSGGTAPVASIAAVTSGVGLIVDNRGPGDLITASSAGLPRFVIKQDGKVGIGTTVPSRLLEVSGINDQYARITSTDADEAGLELYRPGAANTDWRLTNTSGGAFAIRNSTNDFTGFNTKLFLNSTGRLGLGTAATTPDATFEINTVEAHLPVASISGSTSMAALLVDNSGNGDLFVASSEGRTRFNISQNGNIGIGNVTNPGQKLRIVGESGQSELFYITTTGTTTGNMYFDTGAAGQIMQMVWEDNGDPKWNVGKNADNSFSIYNEDTATFTIYAGSDNQVGIGTNNPTFELDVVGDGRFSNDANPVLTVNRTTANNASIAYTNSGGNSWWSGLNSSGDFAWKFVNSDIGSSPNFIFTLDNDFGIGTQDPLASIDVRQVVNSVPVASFSGTINHKAAMIVDNAGLGDIITASSEGRTRFVITQNGTARIWLNGFSTANQGLCHSGSNGATGLVNLGDCNGAPSDYAEWYGTNDTNIDSGDVVAIDPTRNAEEVEKDGVKSSKAWIVKTNEAYQSSTLGIVSTEPNQIIGEVFSEGENPRPVALSGRVPVKIASSSAAIKKGDLITASEVPGRAMKAWTAGLIIGKALEDWKPPVASGSAKDKILVFVNTSWYDPAVTLTQNGNVNIFEDNTDIENPTFFLKDENGNYVLRNGYFAKAVVGDLTVGHIEAKTIKAEKIDVNKLVLAGQDVNSRLNGLEESATRSATLASDLNDLNSKVNNLSDRVASLEADLRLYASGSALLGGNVGNFSASSGAQLNLGSLDTTNATVSDTLSVLGRTLLSDVGITGRVNIGTLSIQGLDDEGYAALNTTAGPLKFQSYGVNGVDFLDGKVTIDTTGNIKTEAAITAKKYNVDTSDTLSASAGKATVKAGQTSLTINTSAVTAKSFIYVTFTSDYGPATRYFVKDQVAGKSFTIELDEPVAKDAKFNWWIVN